MRSAKHTACVLSALLVCGAAGANTDALDRCAFNVQSKFGGHLIALRAEIEDGQAQYQIDTVDEAGLHREVECDPKTGAIKQTERNTRPDDPTFAKKAKVRLDAALKTALDEYPGQVLRIEYEIEGEDAIAYEFDIRNDKGEIMEVEVNAVSGELEGAEKVLYQIGER